MLVVDDEPDFATALAQRFARRGLVAEAVFSGQDALSRLKIFKADVVILDLKMPGMHGLDVLREIRKMSETLRVIVLTGHGTVGTGIAGLEAGAADFMQKPVDFEVLLTAVEALGKEVQRQTTG